MEEILSSPRPKRKKTPFISILKIILGFLLVVFVMSKTSLAELIALAGQVSLGWLGLTFVLFILLSILKAWQYHVLLDSDFPFSQILSVVVLQNAISNFIASSAGIVAYLTMLRSEQGVKISRSGSVFLITKAGDLMAIWLGLIISLFFVWSEIEAVRTLALLLITLTGAGLAAFVLTILLRNKFVDIMNRVFEWTGLVRFRLVQQLLEFAVTLADIEQKYVIRLMITASGLSFIYSLITLAWTYSSFHTFNLPITMPVVVFLNSLLQLLAIIPVQVFGGLGVSEFASYYILDLFGFPREQVAAVLIGLRLLFYLTNLTVLLYLPIHTFFINPSIRKK